MSDTPSNPAPPDYAALRERLARMGFTKGEVDCLAYWIDGAPTIQVAEWLAIPTEQVDRNVRNGLAKLTEAERERVEAARAIKMKMRLGTRHRVVQISAVSAMV